MGRALARKMAARGDRLFVLGRNVDDLARSMRDLEAHAVDEEISHAYCDLTDPSSFVPAFDRAEQALGGFDTVVLVYGSVPDTALYDTLKSRNSTSRLFLVGSAWVPRPLAEATQHGARVGMEI